MRTAGAALAGGALAVVAIAGVAEPGLAMPPPDVDEAMARSMLEAGTAVLAVVAGAVFALHAGLARHIAAAWVGAALLLLGVVTFGLAGFWPLVDGAAAANEGLTWLRPGSRLSAIGLLGYALWTSRRPGPWRRRPTRLLLVASALTGAATVLLQLAPAAGAALASASDRVPTAPSPLPIIPVAAPVALWAAVALAFAALARRRREGILLAVAAMLLALAAGEGAATAATAAGQEWSVAAYALRGGGLLWGLAGATAALTATIRAQRGHLLVRAEEAEARARNSHDRLREQAHEVRNALAGIVGALRTLEEHGEALDPDRQRSLSAAAFAELLRLQHVLAPNPGSGAEPFRVAEALAPVVTGARAQGLDVRVRIPDALTARGSWAQTAQAAQNLLENARRYGGGSPVDLVADAAGDRVLVRVSDRGPGVPPAERERVLERGVRGSSSIGVPGSGLGLPVAADLMAQQGGSLHVEDRAGGGASFILSLPLEATAGSPGGDVAEAVDEREHGVDVRDGDGDLSPARSQDAGPAPRGGRRHAEQRLCGQPGRRGS